MADEDKARGLSPYDLRRILGHETLGGVKLLGKKSDDTFENIRTDDAGRLQVFDPKVGSLISYSGTTTADGAADGSTLLDSVLTGKPDFNGNLVIITSGVYEGQARDINGDTRVAGGTVTPGTAFGGKIVEGTTFVIVGIRTVPVEVAAIEAKLDSPATGLAAIMLTLAAVNAKLVDPATGLAAIINTLSAAITRMDDPATGFTALMNTLGAFWNLYVDPAVGFEALANSIAATITNIAAAEVKLDKLAGETPESDSVTANWNTGEANIVSIGADNTKYKLHSLLLNISALDNDAAGGSAITIRMYMEVNGTERKVYEQTFTQGTDPDGLWIVNGTLGIHEVLRVTAQSDKAPDNGKAIDYDYMLEAM